MNQTQTPLRRFVEGATDHFDLTEPAHQDSLLALTDALLGEPGLTVEDVRAAATDAPLEYRLAAKLVASRRALLAAPPTHVGVVFAMWGEQNRMLPRSADNPNGEDSLRAKIRQLEWATRDTAVEWTLYAVDDGCPHGSGALAETIATQTGASDRVRVLHLAERVPTDDGPLRALTSADDSRKGGSIILGAMQAIADGVDAVVYTDADGSVHLGQLGLLVEPFRSGARVVLGDRRHPESVLVKDDARWGVGIKNLRHMQRMAGEAIFSRGILDTQAAFKLYDAALLREIIAEPVVFDFSFDTDWIAAFLARGESFSQVPFAFLDSASESATAKQLPMTTWETLLKGLVASLRHHDLLPSAASREMADVIDEEVQSYRDLDAIIDALPPELARAGEADYGDPSVMSPAAMRAWIRRCRDESGMGRSGDRP